MQQFPIMLYFILLGSAVYTKNLVFIISCLLLAIAILALSPIFKKIRKQSIKTNIQNNLPAVNINKASWWELEELPSMSRIQAKKAVYIRKHSGKYSSKEDFYEKNSISDEAIKIIDKVIYI